jgi:predicted branched-subunit amino acid permease
MGIALAPSLPGGPLRRAAEGQAVVDVSWALANRGDGTFDRHLLFGTTAPQYVCWFLGTLTGALAGDLLGDTDRLGLDALFPTFFVAILLAELRQPRARVAALLGAAIALALVPFTPPGVPVLAAGAAALVGLGRGEVVPPESHREVST